jgi:hypothetical protein
MADGRVIVGGVVVFRKLLVLALAGSPNLESQHPSSQPLLPVRPGDSSQTSFLIKAAKRILDLLNRSRSPPSSLCRLFPRTSLHRFRKRHPFIMTYGKVDQLAINSIRVLAVRSTLQYFCMTLLQLAIGPSSSRELASLTSNSSDRCHIAGELRPPRCAHGNGSRFPRSFPQVRIHNSALTSSDRMHYGVRVR